MRIQLNCDCSALLGTLHRLTSHIPDWRQHGLQTVLQQTLHTIIQQTPVATGRARSAWVTSLEQLGGIPPAGWPGEQPDSTALSEGATAGELQQQQTQTTTQLTATNSVPYITLLELGTESRSPQLTVTRSIAKLHGRIGSLFPPLIR